MVALADIDGIAMEKNGEVGNWSRRAVQAAGWSQRLCKYWEAAGLWPDQENYGER